MTRERAVTNVTAGVVLLLGGVLFIGGIITIVGDLAATPDSRFLTRCFCCSSPLPCGER